ncbi:MAG TPA: hypothetical protein VH855_05895 [Acetobacteraceae bacterium]|jgi:hypothetical protein
MRRIALASLCLALSGCGYDTWSNPPFSSGNNPHFPAGESENLRRVTGEQFQTPALTPEPGDIWPGPLPPSPTLQDLEQQGGVQPGIERPVPGSPEFQQNQAPSNQPPNPPPPPPARGSSTPPGSTQPGLAPLKGPSPPRPTNTTPPAPNPGGQIVQTPQGPGVTTGGTTGYQTLTTPGGGTAIVVPNGNGTNTIIHSDGRIETVPATR